MSTDPTAGARSYLDFHGLARLRNEAAQGADREVLRKTAEQFEAQFIQMMMKSMRDATVIRGDLLDSQAEDTFQEMMDREVAVRMAQRGALGVADLLERQLSGGVTPTVPSTRQVLAARSAGLPDAGSGTALPLSPAPTAVPLRSGEAAGLPLPSRAIEPLPLRTPGTRPADAAPMPSSGGDAR